MNGCDEDTPLADPLREEPTLVKRLCAERPADTTSEPWGRNAPPGAPVRASMSDGYGRNQGGTVEYFVSHP